MNYRFLFIPIDDRPCTFKMPVELAKIAGVEMVSPPAELLGKFMEPGKCEELIQWLSKVGGKFQGTIIATDMFVYGGLVASRKMLSDRDTVLGRLQKLIDVLKSGKNNFGKIFAFSSLMRVTPTYTDVGLIPLIEKVIGYSTESYHAKKGNAKSKELVEKIGEDIPAEVLSEYLASRERNFTVNKKLLEYAGQGVFDRLLIGLDDSKTVGLNILEREELEEIVNRTNLGNTVSIAPGTDESTSLLLAELLCALTGIHPTIHAVYSHPDGKKTVGRYEDRSFEELVDLHIKISGAAKTDIMKDADILLFVHNPAGSQKEASGQNLFMNIGHNYDPFALSIGRMVVNGRNVAVADVYYANGADNSLVDILLKKINVLKLFSYAAWNTAGNTVGTAVAQSVIRFVSKEINKGKEGTCSTLEAQINMLLERFTDDWIYQSDIRQQLSREALFKGVSMFGIGKKLPEFERSLRMRMENRFNTLMKSLEGKEVYDISTGCKHTFKPWKIKNISLPWGRLFETSFELEK
ncbi:MAG: DUF4127 family protein [Firmicutes bacterium]|nr:DUF4127 family protein [Bacillota bacterium]